MEFGRHSYSLLPSRILFLCPCVDLGLDPSPSLDLLPYPCPFPAYPYAAQGHVRDHLGAGGLCTLCLGTYRVHGLRTVLIDLSSNPDDRHVPYPYFVLDLYDNRPCVARNR